MTEEQSIDRSEARKLSITHEMQAAMGGYIWQGSAVLSGSGPRETLDKKSLGGSLLSSSTVEDSFPC